MPLVLPTEKELACIKHNESKAITDFYNKNFENIRRISYNHCANCHCFDYLADCLNQVYIDLCNYDYSSLKGFYWGIKRSCFNACMFSHIVSLDKPITEDGATLSEIIPDKNITVQEELENEEHLQETVDVTIDTLTKILYKSRKIKKDDFIKLIVYLYPNLAEEDIEKYIGEK